MAWVLYAGHSEEVIPRPGVSAVSLLSPSQRQHVAIDGKRVNGLSYGYITAQDDLAAIKIDNSRSISSPAMGVSFHQSKGVFFRGKGREPALYIISKRKDYSAARFAARHLRSLPASLTHQTPPALVSVCSACCRCLRFILPCILYIRAS